MIGETIGNFEVISQLGQGGMGEVLLAEHKDIRTRVAIKMLLPHICTDQQQVQRFFNEAVAVSKIKHAGIAKIFDVGFHAGTQAYLVMEFLDGESLANRIARAGRLPLAQVADIARQIASVLEATHAEGITHRDLKPDNIFLVPDAELASGERVKILDFGIAKLSSSGITQTGGAMGTPAYMSPEQWKNTAKVDGRADIYSLGCLVFEMACGHPPFVADSIGELCVFHLNETPPRVRALAPEMPAALDELVAALLAKSADERPSLRDAKRAFAAWASDVGGATVPALRTDASQRWDSPAPGAVTTTKPTTLGSSAMALPVTQAPARRSKLPLIAGASVVAVGGLVLAVVLARGDGAAPAAAPDASVAVETAPPAPATVPAAEPVPAAPAPPTTRMRIETQPAGAEILIDNAAVTNPFDGKFPRSDVRHRIEVRAPGYVADSRWVVFDANQTLVIELEREPVAATTKGRPPKLKAKPAASIVTTKPAVAPTQPDRPATAVEPTKPIYKGTKATIMTDFPTQ